MNKSDLIKMRESITPGEWNVTEGDIWGVRPVCCNRPDCDEYGYTCCGSPDPEQFLIAQSSEQDAEAIAALPAILDHAIKLEEEVERLRR